MAEENVFIHPSHLHVQLAPSSIQSRTGGSTAAVVKYRSLDPGPTDLDAESLPGHADSLPNGHWSK
jgi:hypothetical protein